MFWEAVQRADDEGHDPCDLRHTESDVVESDDLVGHGAYVAAFGPLSRAIGVRALNLARGML